MMKGCERVQRKFLLSALSCARSGVWHSSHEEEEAVDPLGKLLRNCPSNTHTHKKKWRQKDQNFKIIFAYIGKSRPAWARDPIERKKRRECDV